MTDIAIAHVKRSKARAGKSTGSVHEKRMRTSEGKVVRVLSLDANSKTFVDDLTSVFARNVRKARSENVKLFGSADGLKPKKKK